MCVLYIRRTNLVEDDEDELHDLLPGGGVGDGLLDLGEADVAVAARGAEELALEAAAVVGAYDARHVGEPHVALAARLFLFVCLFPMCFRLGLG